MRSRSRPRRGLAAALVTAVLLGAPAAAWPDELEDVKERREAVEQRLVDTTTRAEQLEADIATRKRELRALADREQELEIEIARTRRVLEERAREAFKQGGGDLGAIAAMVDSRAPGEMMARAATLDVLARRDQAAIETAESLQVQLDQTRALRRAAIADLGDLRREALATAETLGDQLEGLQTRERTLELKAARQADVRRGPQQGIYACILQEPFTYIDSWGFARSGGRSHKGTDVMAPHGNEVYAFTAGTVRLSSNRLGGVVAYLDGDDGHRYYYAHLAGYAPGLASGARVEPGQLIATNGNSGNARGGAAHVHFEVHPGGGGAVNPYPWLRPVC